MSGPSRRTFLFLGAAYSAAAQQTTTRPATPPLRYRALGKTGLKVTELGFGSEAVSDSSVFERALDAGVNFFDTARPYQGGNNEVFLGAALGNRRKQIILSTRSYAKTPKEAAADLDISLKSLKTDYVDLWYLGQKDQPGEITAEMVEVQYAAQKAGKIRFRAMSSHRIGAMVDLAIAHKMDVVQIPYNFAIGTRRDPFKMESANLDTAIDRLHAAGIGIVAMKVMAGGYHMERIEEKNADIHARAGAHVAAIRWALRHERINTTSVRMTDADQLSENLHAMAGRYSEEDGRLLAAYSDAIRPFYCRMCGSCDGHCPKGTPVSDVVRSIMYAEGYGRHDLAAAAFQHSVGKLRCGECSACTVACPNGVNLAERMHRARQLFA